MWLIFAQLTNSFSTTLKSILVEILSEKVVKTAQIEYAMWLRIKVHTLPVLLSLYKQVSSYILYCIII